MSKYCTECGNKLTEKDKYCTGCGQAQHSTMFSERNESGPEPNKTNPNIIERNILVIIVIVFALLFSAAVAANVDTRLNYSESRAIAFVSYGLGRFLAQALIAGLTMYFISKSLVRRTGGKTRWVLAIGILIIVILFMGFTAINDIDRANEAIYGL